MLVYFNFCAVLVEPLVSMSNCSRGGLFAFGDDVAVASRTSAGCERAHGRLRQRLLRGRRQGQHKSK